LSYKQRERKRRSLIIEKSKLESRKTDSASEKYWLTFVSRKTCCSSCGVTLQKGKEMVFRFKPLDSLCVSCAVTQKIPYRTSALWEKNRVKKISKSRYISN
jgi:RNase P subunit RPR2